MKSSSSPNITTKPTVSINARPFEKRFCQRGDATAGSRNGSKLTEDIDLKIELGPVQEHSVFKNDQWSHWGGSVVKDGDGIYHMLYSRWPKKLGWAWVTDSEIAHAVSNSPLGPYRFKDVALARSGKQHWDGWCTHNPTVHKFGNKYYLYYMGNTGDGEIAGEPGKQKLNWQHRNNQRIGVAVADSPNGPWKRMDKPVLDVSEDDNSWDCLMASNPSVCQRPDGKILMVYKAVGKKFPMPNGGPVVHCVALADKPTGPFVKSPDPVFTFEGERFPAEDPYIWFQAGKFRAIVKRIKFERKKRLFSLVQYDSIDGIQWKPSKNHAITDRTIRWADGTTEKLAHLERPQVVIENGKPTALICAADRINDKNVRVSFNVQIPLIVTETKQAKPKTNAPESPTWTDPNNALTEYPNFKYIAEYTLQNESGQTGLQVTIGENRFYTSTYRGGLPGAGWNGGTVAHERLDEASLLKKLADFSKVDRSVSESKQPPENAIVLFDGSNKDQFSFGKIRNGLLEAGAKTTKQDFTNFKLHFECMTPFKPGLPLSHPHRGNSGVFALGCYEIQICDTFGLELDEQSWKTEKLLKHPNTACGSIYGIRAPSVNMNLPPLSWESFDIEFTAAKFNDDGSKTKDARITVIQNGVTTHDDIALPRGTGGGPKGPRPEVASGPIYFQNHNNPNMYRNIWVVDLAAKVPNQNE